jgi:hypothetical protein
MDHVFCSTKKRLISGNRGSTYSYDSTNSNKLSIRLVGSLVVWLVIGPAQTADSQT